MRRSKRIALDEPARLHPNDWSSLEVRILDFSENGFRAQCDATMLVNSRIRVDIPGVGPAEAIVAWRRKGEIGAQFVRPLDLDLCEWEPACEEKLLVKLLVERASLYESGQAAQEREVRRRILSTLPMRRLSC